MEDCCFNPSQRVYSISSNYIDTPDKKASSLGSVTVFIFKSNQFLRPNVQSTHNATQRFRSPRTKTIHPSDEKEKQRLCIFKRLLRNKTNEKGEKSRERGFIFALGISFLRFSTTNTKRKKNFTDEDKNFFKKLS